MNQTQKIVNAVAAFHAAEAALAEAEAEARRRAKEAEENIMSKQMLVGRCRDELCRTVRAVGKLDRALLIDGRTYLVKSAADSKLSLEIKQFEGEVIGV